MGMSCLDKLGLERRSPKSFDSSEVRERGGDGVVFLRDRRSFKWKLLVIPAMAWLQHCVQDTRPYPIGLKET